MQSSRSWKTRCFLFAAGMLMILGASALFAQHDNKNSSNPQPSHPESAAPARSAAPPSAPSHGPSTAGGSHSAPTASYPGTHGGTTANNPVHSAPASNPSATVHRAPISNAPAAGYPHPANGTSTGHNNPTATAPSSVHTAPASNLPGTVHTGSAVSGPAHGHTGMTASSPAPHGGAAISPVSHHDGSTPSHSVTGASRTPPPVNPNKPGIPKESAIDGRAHTGILGRPAPRGSQQVQLKNGSAVQRRPNGRISDVHDAHRGMNVHHGINGNTRVVVVRADHSRVFAERGRPGYVQRGYVYHGHEYSRRTYYYHGRAYDRYYRGYPYRGVYINVYSPVRYYPAGFYGWAYNPWYHPVVYSWGWGRAPWYGYYGGYFTPYPAYATASLWLTDYIISNELAAAYQARQESQIQMDREAAEGSAPLTPEVKQMIADEVKNQLALENAEAQQNARNQEPDPNSSGIARMLTDGKTHVFVAGSSLDVVNADGNECSISDGDALELATPPPPDATSANLIVLSSKGGRECRKSDTVAVTLADLQDMQNHMRETIDQGLQELQAKQGTGGLPAAPPSARGAAVDAPIAQGAPPPDPNDASAVNQQLAEADQAEKEVTNEAQQEAPAPAAGPTTIALGQSIDQVTASLGQPETVVDLGPKKIYKYQDMKVTFKDGRVADVE